MKVAYVVYPDFTALDLVGPYEVISRGPDVEVHFVASASGPVTTDCGLTVVPTDTPETLPSPDMRGCQAQEARIQQLPPTSDVPNFLQIIT